MASLQQSNHFITERSLNEFDLMTLPGSQASRGKLLGKGWIDSAIISQQGKESEDYPECCTFAYCACGSLNSSKSSCQMCLKIGRQHRMRQRPRVLSSAVKSRLNLSAHEILYNWMVQKVLNPTTVSVLTTFQVHRKVRQEGGPLRRSSIVF